jgi:3-hydroxybutyrate dehydrogenase
MKLKNKVALITGAASGIGHEIAKLYAKEGVKVVIPDLNLDGANKAAQAIKDQGGEAMGGAMNVTDEDQVNAGVVAAVKAYGSIDVLVSNAGTQHIEAVENIIKRSTE